MATSAVDRAPYGVLHNGTPVEVFTLCNVRGMQARIATYGGILTSLTAPDRAGQYADVVLGHDSLEGYLSSSPYFGALIGRYANRLANGRFELGGRSYALGINESPNTLHGGLRGFDKVMWSVLGAEVTSVGAKLSLAYLSRDGEEGFPGNLSVNALYTLTNDNELRVDFTATSDATTVLNLTQHSYFNLRGEGDVLDHLLQIKAEKFAPLNAVLIPTGELRSVEGTAFDFRTPVRIGARIAGTDEQLRIGQGYDHDWLTPASAGALALQARACEDQTGRVLEVLSTQPSLHLYSGNLLDGTITGKRGTLYRARSGFCLESQHLPNSPNEPRFPSTVLEPGQTYTNTIVWRFSAR